MATIAAPQTKLDFSKLKFLAEKTWANWGREDVPRLAAAFAFYAILALAPLLVLAVVVASSLYGTSLDAEHAFLVQAQSAVGPDGRALVKEMIESGKKSGSGEIATIVSLLITFFSASNLFLQFNETIYAMWGIRRSGPALLSFVKTRLGAFAGVLVFGALVLAWLGVDSWLGWLEAQHSGFLAWRMVSFAVSVVFLASLFAVSFRAVPRNRLKWSDVWLGALFSAFGVALAKLLLSLYFAGFNVSAGYGSAGALVVILLWIYYTSQIYFFGAEITYTYAHEFGSQVGVEESGLEKS
jgi:membrane protein